LEGKDRGFGSGGSRLLGGDHEVFHRLESRVAGVLGMPASLVFNSGYQCNLGVVSTVVSVGDVVFLDRLCHASIVDGVRLSGARFFRFRHGDVGHLRALLGAHRGQFRRALVVTESVFSMDGDVAPLREIVALKSEFDFLLMVDESHGMGVFGPEGGGVVRAEGLSDQVDILVGTFGKAYGSCGAFVGCSEALKAYLIQYCRSFIYSTSLPLPVILFNLHALEYVATRSLGEQLLAKADRFRGMVKSEGYEVLGESHIVPVVVGESGRTLALSRHLKSCGVLAPAIRTPTVPVKEGRVRFSVSVLHRDDHFERVCQALRTFK